ncbi:6-phosphogluconolactonase [Cognatilysobacter lacus]|uniref:6-phosphogluconolactonase n=1 Tax=Cognatilysobacter lacus TaxID=1643323 RepID=A0A5D8YXG2_9GAMM|nr:6-phosphogluconolactonase [Lysobacter lacus]TZF87070.1 6-phosphogluconolactonase [Lysobacter lacus]
MVFGPLPGEPSTEHRTLAVGDAQLYLHRDAHVWTWAAAVMIVAELRRDLAARPRSRLLLSPSEGVVPVLKALSRAPLDWQRVDVGLVDERWLQPDDPDSHASAIRRHLLVDRAAGARLEPLTLAGRRIEDAVAIANAHARQMPDVSVLTMGDDGHVAALFTDSPDYARALASRQDYMCLDGAFSPSAGPWPRRITATPLGLSRAGTRILLLRGDAQRRHFDVAMAATDGGASPLAAVRLAGGPPLLVHWCP